MKKHYISPWLVVDDVEGANIGYRAIVTRDGDTVCDPSPMGEDRARLIAAAPELLNALRNIESAADYAKDNPRKQTDKLFDILEAARAAIYKATGAQP